MAGIRLAVALSIALAAALLEPGPVRGAQSSGAAEPADASSNPLAAELAAAGPGRLEELQAELASAGRERIARIAAAGGWTPPDVARLAQGLLVDASRFGGDPAFRLRVVPAIARALPPGTPASLRDQLLLELSRVGDLLALAPIEAAWGAARRPVLDRLIGASYRDQPAPPAGRTWPEMRLGPAEGRIAVSVYSLASAFFSAGEGAEFLAAVRRRSPERAIVVLTDYPQSLALAEAATGLGIQLGQTWSKVYSPWPRDAMSFLVRPDGAQVAVLRPNRQPGRESDSDMGLELLQDLPAELDARFGPLDWTIAPVPFHNGNLIPAADELWISIHTLEPRILELLGLDRVPVESFSELGGTRRYIEVARAAASELERLFGRPARFVHPLPFEGSDGAAAGAADARTVAASMRRLGGGAGFDLDSLVTLLPAAAGGPAALVGDLGAGGELIAASPDAELDRLRAAYRLDVSPADLRSTVESWRERPRASGLAGFLDLVAEHLATSGFAVRRLPLVLVPTTLLERSEDYADPDFLLGWNNVVLESIGERRRAEGFAVLLGSGDSRARALFAELGYELELLPPLIESVLRNGGYRCASNHIREN